MYLISRYLGSQESTIEALNFIEFAGLSHAIEVRIGQCEELVEELILGNEIVRGGKLDIYGMFHDVS